MERTNIYGRITVIGLLGILMVACGAPVTTAGTGGRVQAVVTPVDEGGRIVKHARGELTFARPATRIIACSEEAADFALTLGVQLVGFCSGRVEGAQNGMPMELAHFFDKKLLGSPVFLGNSTEPALEEIVKLKPDLILTTEDGEKGYSQLSAIAPTMVIDTTGAGYWSETLVEVGKALGREAAAREYLEEFERTSLELHTRLAPVVARTPNVLFIYSFAASDGTMVFDDRWSGSKLLTRLGFKLVVPDDVAVPPAGFASVSPEIVRDVKADIIVVIRPKHANGSIPRYPIDDVLDNLQDVRVVRQEIASTRGSTAPLTDKLVLEDLARLLAEAQ